MTNQIPNKIIENLFKGFFILLPFVFSSAILDPFLIPRSLFTICFLLFVLLFLWSKKRIDFRYLDNISLKLLASFFICSIITFSQSWLISESLFTLSRQLIIAVFFILTFVLLSENIIRKESLIKSVIFFGITALTITLLAILNKTINGQHLLAQVDTLTGTFANKNLLSSILFLCLPFYFIGFSYQRKIRIIATIAIVLTIFILVVARTRTVLLALLVFLGLLLFRILKNKFTPTAAIKKTTLLISISSLAMLMIFYFVKNFQNSSFNKSIFNTYFERMISSDTLNTRILFWKNSILMFKENFLFGVGPGNWQIYFPKYGLNNFTRPDVVNGLVSVQNPHNDFLWILCENGIVGFIFYFGFVFYSLYQAFWLFKNSENQSEKKNFYYLFCGIIGYLIISFFDFPSSRIEHQVVFMVFLAIINHSYFKERKITENFRAKFYLPFLLIICLGFSLLISLKRFESETHVFKIETLQSKNNWDKIISETNFAKNKFYEIDSKLFPMEWYQGLVCINKNDYPKSLELFKKAYEKNPYNINVINNYAGSLELNDNRKKAIKYYHEALVISTNFENARLNFAACYYKEKDFEKAFLIIDKLDINNSNLNYKNILGPILKKKIELIIKSLNDKKGSFIGLENLNNNDYLIQLYIQSKRKKSTFEDFIKIVHKKTDRYEKSIFNP